MNFFLDKNVLKYARLMKKITAVAVVDKHVVVSRLRLFNPSLVCIIVTSSESGWYVFNNKTYSRPQGRRFRNFCGGILIIRCYII